MTDPWVAVRVWCRKRRSASSRSAVRASGSAGSGASTAQDAWSLTTGRPPSAKPAKGLVRFLELHGEMAGVQADPEVFVVEAAELPYGLLGGLHDAARLRFEADPDGAAGPRFEPGEPDGQPVQGPAGRVGALAGPGGAPAERQGGDAAPAGVVGEEGGEDASAVEGVGESRLVRPVGEVDVLLDDLAVESLVRKGVEGDGLQAARGQLCLESRQRVRVGGEFGDCGAGQPQPDAEAVDTQALTHGLGVAGELAYDALQVLRLVDVAAVREVDGGAVGVAEAHGRFTLPRV